jgi:thioredoxin type arsenate reductase
VADRPIRVLFVCTGNSARSQIAEALLEKLGGPAFEVDSAGTDPKGVNPYTVRILGEHGIDWSGAASKSVGHFVGQSFDHVVTVCDQARQVCPVFPGQYSSLHWDLEDPAEVTGSDADKADAFRRTYAQLATLVPAFIESATPLRARTAGR